MITSTRYFTSDMFEPKTVLRRVDYVDEAFRHGVWRPTKEVIDWNAGHNDFVDEVTESEARAVAPAAFN